jgi:glycosyltransferase involved in cell wall biosynthesis
MIFQAQRVGGQKISGMARVRNVLDSKLIEKSLQGASLVFCNSHFVGNWLTTRLELEPSRVQYAPCAPGVDFSTLSRKVKVEEVRRRLGASQGYLLTFFTGDHRENFGVLPEIYRRLRHRGITLPLVIAGVRESARSCLETMLGDLKGHEGIRMIPFLGAGKEQELADIYTAASVYFDPSLHEGFGMQVIEAMACGTPVVCSNRGALPEVAGDAALLTDPQNSEENVQSIARVLSSSDLQKELRARGYQRSNIFTWERTARAVAEGLVRAASQG